jgi:hypothetical protein
VTADVIDQGRTRFGASNRHSFLLYLLCSKFVLVSCDSWLEKKMNVPFFSSIKPR